MDVSVPFKQNPRLTKHSLYKKKLPAISELAPNPYKPRDGRHPGAGLGMMFASHPVGGGDVVRAERQARGWFASY